MAPRRKRAAESTVKALRPRRSTRQATRTNPRAGNNGIPNVYQDMLNEAAAETSDDYTSNSRATKRRKVSPDRASEVDDLFESPPPPLAALEPPRESPGATTRPQQIVYDDFENSDESEVEFEDVELEPVDQPASEDEIQPQKSLQIDLNKSVLETPKRTVPKRKPISKAERLMRLDVHKWHLLSLVGHGLQRNAWCNNEAIHNILKPLVSRKIIKLLHVDESKPQYERNHSFTKGVEEICMLWRQQWKTVIHGLRRAYWREDVDARNEVDEGEDVEFDDFRDAARTCSGSRDLGAQLFTALLRSIAVEARLVFSLQVLPFTGAAKGETPSKTKTTPNYIQAPAQNYGVTATGASPFTPPQKRSKKPKKIIDSQFPIFWTEILSPNQIWTPLDPIVRNSISKPKTQFEPPLSDNLNSMTYVVAYEEDNSAHDVTRRYTQWFNAKTRKTRVESTKNGEQWYTSVMAVLRKRLREPRDEVEDDELARRSNSEGMPNSIQDFKNHPVYVLERHMRANEVLQPRREVGKVNVGTSKNGKIESVYRRQDVYLCRSADAWYRRGRDVKMGEQPLKHVLPKNRPAAQRLDAGFSDDEGDDENEAVGLYAEYQTDVYEPPPVVNGQIPKNAYGNLDIYVTSMIPPGAVHISHKLAAAAAKTIGVDFADAVTGFEFKGRQGTAVVDGIVVAEQFTAAVAAVIGSLEALGSEEVQQARSKIVVAMWKKMLQALRVRDRIEAEYGSTDTSKQKRKRRVDDYSDENEDGNDSAYEDEEMDSDVGGGFMPDDAPTEEKVQEQAVSLQVLKSKMPTLLPEEVVSVPIKIQRSPHKLPVPDIEEGEHTVTAEDAGDNDLFEDQGEDEDMAGGFVPEGGSEGDMGGGFVPEDSRDNTGGGFMAEDETETGGGFIQEDTPPQPTNSTRTVSKTGNSTTKSKPRSELSVGNTSTNKKTAPNIRTKPHVSSTNDNTIASAEHADINATIAMDAIHSDTEEDTALQLAIAESLAPAPAPQTSNPEILNQPGPPHQADHSEPDIQTRGKQRPNDAIPSSQSKKGTDSEARSPESLLSHDPAEDEEEPDWLNEALE